MMPTIPAFARQPWVAMLLILVAMAARAQTFGNPVIELDEQFYRLVGERMLAGDMPYIDLFDTKPIGLFLLFALAALIGGAHALSYQIMAALCAGLAGCAVHAMARRLCTGWLAPIMAGILSILWLNLMQGEGGQASVIYAPFVAGAALIALRQVMGERREGALLLRDGLSAMTLMGLAIQLKYTVVVEGGLFGLALLWTGWRQGLGVARLAGYGTLWCLVALLPTGLAAGTYLAMGQGEAWYFANFTSVGLRGPMPLPVMLEEFGGSMALLSLLLIAAALGWWRRPRGNPGMIFVGLWLLMALAAIFAVHSFTPHYWIPLLLPLSLLAVPALERMWRAAIMLCGIAAIVSQVLVAILIAGKGDARTMAHIKAAMGPLPNCVFVFDGYPALYLEADSCLPSRFLFPNMLNGVVLEHALGVDPVTEVERIMATRPSAVILDEPRWELRNKATTAIVDRELAAHYQLVLREPTGKGRWRLVYRVKQADARH